MPSIVWFFIVCLFGSRRLHTQKSGYEMESIMHNAFQGINGNLTTLWVFSTYCILFRKPIFVRCLQAEGCECICPAGKRTMWTLCVFPSKRMWTIKLPQFKNLFSIVNKIAWCDIWWQNLAWYENSGGKTNKWFHVNWQWVAVGVQT